MKLKKKDLIREIKNFTINWQSLTESDQLKIAVLILIVLTGFLIYLFFNINSNEHLKDVLVAKNQLYRFILNEQNQKHLAFVNELLLKAKTNAEMMPVKRLFAFVIITVIQLIQHASAFYDSTR